MEQMVSTPDVHKVALVCDRKYVEKANARSGGVGAETQIISPQIYAKEEQSKFVAIVAERDENNRAHLPIYYQSRIYIDLSDSDLYAKNYEQLLRWIYDKPLYIKPEIRTAPAFLPDSVPSRLGTSTAFKRALDAIRAKKDYRIGAVNEYLDRLAQEFEALRLESDSEAFDDKVIISIEEFLPYRNEAIEVFVALSQYENTPETHRAVHRFFERLLPYLGPAEHVTTFREWDFDNFRFIVHELFLYAVAAFVKYERFDAVGYFVRHDYYVEAHGSQNGAMLPFSAFREYMKCPDHRNQRLRLRKLSLRAFLL
jgi:hypothetical protein